MQTKLPGVSITFGSHPRLYYTLLIKHFNIHLTKISLYKYFFFFKFIVRKNLRSKMTNAFTGKVFLLVTGASRGIGKQIAQSFVSLLEGKSHVLLLSRNSELLKKSVDEMPEGVVASYKSIDFSQTTTDELKGT